MAEICTHLNFIAFQWWYVLQYNMEFHTLNADQNDTKKNIVDVQIILKFHGELDFKIGVF